MSVNSPGVCVYFFLAVLLGGQGLLSGCQRGGTPPERPSIFLVTMDALRPDHLGSYGYQKGTSPNIDSFASDSLLFENCFAHAPETRFSFGSILTGYFPHETTVIDNKPLPEGVKSIAEILREKGYTTVAVISNFMLRAGRGYEQGFTVYDDRMEDIEQVRKWPERTAERTTDRAIELLRRFKDESLFMWIHYQDPHGPYTPPEPYSKLFENPGQEPRPIRVNKSLSGRGGIPAYQDTGLTDDYYSYLERYDGEIRYMDDHFRRFLDEAASLGFYDSSLFILTSDHGEGMGEHDYFFAHGDNLYQEMLHVPLVLRYGDGLRGRRKEFVQHLDIVPTILAALGETPDPSYRGRNLLQLPEEDIEIFAEMNSAFVRDSQKFSLLTRDGKLIYTPRDGTYEYYDLSVDPGEEHNLISDPRYKDQVERLQKGLNRLRNEDRLNLGAGSAPPPVSEQERAKMRSLGYIR